jgi:hypothetical protein
MQAQNNFNHFVEEILSWDDFRKKAETLADKYVFRGQQRSCWPLQSSIERAFKQFDISKSPFENVRDG